MCTYIHIYACTHTPTHQHVYPSAPSAGSEHCIHTHTNKYMNIYIYIYGCMYTFIQFVYPSAPSAGSESCTVAPYARQSMYRSVMFGVRGIVSTSVYPFAAATYSCVCVWGNSGMRICVVSICLVFRVSGGERGGEKTGFVQRGREGGSRKTKVRCREGERWRRERNRESERQTRMHAYTHRRNMNLGVT